MALELEKVEGVLDISEHNHALVQKPWEQFPNKELLEFEALGRELRRVYSQLLSGTSVDKDRMIPNLKRDLCGLIREYDIASNEKTE